MTEREQRPVSEILGKVVYSIDFNMDSLTIGFSDGTDLIITPVYNRETGMALDAELLR